MPHGRSSPSKRCHRLRRQIHCRRGLEAASVKLAAPGDQTLGTLPAISVGRLEFRNVTLRVMMYYSYGTGLRTAMNVSGGPDWMNRNRYTIAAVAQGTPTDRDYRAMLRRLIEERFAVIQSGPPETFMAVLRPVPYA
jgi:uncharacterized protein (TIGR03435 family)